jgi:hypothetical protein
MKTTRWFVVYATLSVPIFQEGVENTKIVCLTWSAEKYWISLSIKLMSTYGAWFDLRPTPAASTSMTIGTNLCVRKESDWSSRGGGKVFSPRRESSKHLHSLRKQRRLWGARARGEIMGDIPGLRRKLISRCAFPSNAFCSRQWNFGPLKKRAAVCLGGERNRRRVKIHERRVWKTMKSWAREWFIRSPLIILCPPE